LAQTFGIRVYTIGVGSMGTAPYPFNTVYGVQVQNIPVEIDEDVLTQIAEKTGGKYFRATNNEKLKMIYNEIDQLEKTKIDIREFTQKTEEYLKYVLFGLLLLAMELILRYTVLRQIP